MTVHGNDTVLVLDRVPIRLPEPVAWPLTELTNQPTPPGWVANHPDHWLFPSTEPGRHLSGGRLGRRLAAHGIPNRPARATALVQLAQDMPPAVLAPMLGLHTNTLVKRRRRAATDWTAYLEGRRTSREPGDDTAGP
ncbi:hypothetical protein AB0O91_28175 [Kitasatospora sp. NPDC089797]|uniref:hypothetical protein n=1 Tax=Kitasatospora sp. NPDC089797 TaxID=3155298 RepID=UPI003421371B